MVLNCNVPVTFVSFGSDVVPARGFSVAFVRFPAVCGLSMVFNLAFGAVSLYFLLGGSLKGHSLFGFSS